MAKKRYDRQSKVEVVVPIDPGDTLTGAMKVEVGTEVILTVPVNNEQRLTKEEGDFIVTLFAEFTKADEIRAALARRFGRGVDKAWVYTFKQTHKKQIQKAREEYLADFANIPMAHAKVRVLELQAIYDKVKKEGNTWYQLETLSKIATEVAPIMEELFPHGTDEEAKKWLQAVARGQTDLGSD